MTQWLAEDLCPHVTCWSLKAQQHWPEVAPPMAEAVLQFPALLTCGQLIPPKLPASQGLGRGVAWKQRWSQSSILAPPRGLFWG